MKPVYLLALVAALLFLAAIIATAI